TIKAATSPVWAPSSATGAQSCAETLIFDPSSRSATLFSAVKTGAMTTSQWLALATSGFRARAVATESPIVLYIFQFPAMTGLRMRGSIQKSGVWVRSQKQVICPSEQILPATLRPPETPTWRHHRLRYALCDRRRRRVTQQQRNHRLPR